MFKNTLRAKNLQRTVFVLLVAVMLIGLLSGGVLATGYSDPVPFASPIAWGVVGPTIHAGLAPWTLYDDGTVIVGAGDVRGMSQNGVTDWTAEASISPWENYRTLVTHIIFTEPVNAIDNLSGLFANLPNLTAIDGLGYFNFIATGTSAPRIWMTNMFRGPNLLTTLDLTGWDVSQVSRFTNMFRDASALYDIVGLDTWNTNIASRMNGMFWNASSLTSLDISSFNTSSVTLMENMFRDASGLTSLDIGSWNTGSATNMSSMFRGASGLTSLDISSWNTGNVTNMSHIFRGVSSLTSLDLSGWNTSNVGGSGERMESAFRDMAGLTSLNLGSWDTSSLANNQMGNMFTGSTALRELTLGPAWNVVTGTAPGLTASPIPGYTGQWQNMPTFTVPTLVNPPGLRYYLPGDLMTGTTGAPLSSEPSPITWYWRRAVLTVTFLSGPNGTIDPTPPVNELVFSGDTLAEAGISLPTTHPDLVPAPGFKFVYWEDQHGVQFPYNNLQPLLDLPITENKTLTAIFVDSTAIPVIFDLDGGLYGGYPYDVTLWVLPEYLISQANISIPVPTRLGWIFTGWREDNTGDLLTAAQVGAEVVTAPRTFVAQWTQSGSGGGFLPPPTEPTQPTEPEPEPEPLERQAYLIGADGLIRPNDNITRAEVATIFFRLITDEARAEYWMQDNLFSDVELQNWFNNAVSTMTNAGVFNGFPDGTFAPNQTITRAEMTAVIVRFMDEMEGVHLLGNQFNDIANHWAMEYINTAAVNGWVQGPHGLDGAFYPDRPITRAEVTAIINRISNRLQERTEDLLPDMLTWPDNANENAWFYFYIQSATNSYTFRWRGADNAFEQWINIIPARDWAVLERPDSRPDDILRP